MYYLSCFEQNKCLRANVIVNKVSSLISHVDCKFSADYTMPNWVSIFLFELLLYVFNYFQIWVEHLKGFLSSLSNFLFQFWIHVAVFYDEILFHSCFSAFHWLLISIIWNKISHWKNKIIGRRNIKEYFKRWMKWFLLEMISWTNIEN